MNQLTKFRFKWTIDHEDLLHGWKWLLHTLHFLLLSLSLLSFSLKIIDCTLLTLYSEKWIHFGVLKKTLHQKSKIPISNELCWVWHIWVILHMRGKPNPIAPTSFHKMGHTEDSNLLIQAWWWVKIKPQLGSFQTIANLVKKRKLRTLQNSVWIIKPYVSDPIE